MIDLLTYKILKFISGTDWASYDLIMNFIKNDALFHDSRFDEYSLDRILDAYCEDKPTDENAVKSISIPAGQGSRFNYRKLCSFKLNITGKLELNEFQIKCIYPQLDHQINIDSLKTARDSLVESKVANTIANQSLSEAKISNELSRKSNKLSRVSIGFAIGSLVVAILSAIPGIISLIMQLNH